MLAADNLLANGDFGLNQTDLGENNWDIFYYGASQEPEEPGEEKFEGWEIGGPVELWSEGWGGWVELDSDQNGPSSRWGEAGLKVDARKAWENGNEPGSTWISQTVDVEAGKVYALSFEFGGRNGYGADDNKLKVTVGGATTALEETYTKTGEKTIYFTAAGTQVTVKFADAGESNTFGTLVREISLEKVNFDLDIDSDNDGPIEGGDWEEHLENHAYGLGKLVMQNYNTDDVGEDAANFTPVVLRLPANISAESQVRIDYDVNSDAGSIFLYTVDKPIAAPFLDSQGLPLPGALGANQAGGIVVHPHLTYSLGNLNFDPVSSTVTLFVAGLQENPTIKTLKGVDDNGKPQKFIKATLVQGDRDVVTDRVKYIVTQEDSFFFDLQTEQKVRSALASRGVYKPASMPQFSLQRLASNDLQNLGVTDNGNPENTHDIQDLLGNGTSGIDGFEAALYYNYTSPDPGHFVLAFRGTDDIIDDNIANGLQGTGFGIFSEQYRAALEIGDVLKGVAALQSHTIIAGHSLGGGLASAAYTTSGFKTDTFNAAGLKQSTLRGPLIPGGPFGFGGERYAGSFTRFDNPASVTAYHVDYDILTYIQEVSFDKFGIVKAILGIDLESPLPNALGIPADELDGPYDTDMKATNPLNIFDFPKRKRVRFNSHSMNAVLHGLLHDGEHDNDRAGALFEGDKQPIEAD